MTMPILDDNDDRIFRRAFSKEKAPKPEPPAFLSARVLRAAQQEPPKAKLQTWVPAVYGFGCCIALEAFTGWNGQSLILAPAAVAVWLAKDRILAICAPFLR
jgi:hypothetical protein